MLQFIRQVFAAPDIGTIERSLEDVLLVEQQRRARLEDHTETLHGEIAANARQIEESLQVTDRVQKMLGAGSEDMIS